VNTPVNKKINFFADEIFYDLMDNLKTGEDKSLFTYSARKKYIEETEAITDQSPHISGGFAITKKEWTGLGDSTIIFSIRYNNWINYKVTLRKKSFKFYIAEFSDPEFKKIKSPGTLVTPLPFLTADSVRVENLSGYGQFSYDGKKYFDVVMLRLKVTNKSYQMIPDFSVSNRCQYIKCIINGDAERLMMTLCNGMEALGGNKFIPRDSPCIFEYPWALSDTVFGKTIKIQWEYAGIRSPLKKFELAKSKSE
jgi:hypothetical protein